jgi:hypothetical protein
MRMKHQIPEVLEKRYLYPKQHSAAEEPDVIALELFAENRLGLIADIAATVSALKGDITYFHSWIAHEGMYTFSCRSTTPATPPHSSFPCPRFPGRSREHRDTYSKTSASGSSSSRRRSGGAGRIRRNRGG